ncbi:uncharacterized protein OCT59_019259 [Rhizophagus irregularis]|uniref:uncharacterized protein n=1 Tax=Rhizophagus irregularis TaxID=588596 RepID=UPI0033205106|nr:hypothetical protein OCT59_019259 [Rhizophagus irregularis]
MTSFNDWIDKKIKNGDIDYIEYREFNNVKKVGRGGFGLVESADWKSCGIKIALKSLLDNSSVDENSMNEFVKELKNLKKVSFHPNIITFFGISKEKYAMVLDFANQGNLREYLAIHFNDLEWSDKIQMASDIVCGLKCLHFKHIIHRDLHAKNILVNNNRLMIADFGASKQLSEANSTNSTNSTADGIGMIEYMEPQRFVFINHKKTKKSDIYGLGVLLWEISSGRSPFHGIPRPLLCTHIYHNNLRETPIEGTPLKYQQLYQKCWENDPNLRPDIEEVYDILIKLKSDYFPDLPSILLESESDSQSSFNGIDSNQSKLMIPRSSDNTIEAAGNEGFRNLLIVGYASSGKSTLSNVLCATDEFEESECSARNIRNFQKNIFKWNGTTYRLIDIGFSSIKKILCNKTEILQLIPEGISQVLLVVDGRFKEKEIEAFEFFEKTILESGIIGYTTIVRTKFCNFKNKNKCEEDKKQMCEESKTIAKMVESCSIIHVDNPPTNIIVNDNDDQERINYNRKTRERSRTLLLSHLEFVCQNKYYEYNNVIKYSQLVIDLIPFLEKKGKEMTTPIPDELEEKKIRNLLVVGYSGSGKSTLTNVLNDTGHLEGNKQIRKTKNFQKRVFKRNETEYRIVDTIGIGDINLTKKQVICEKIAEVFYLLPEGISQVLFVIDGKFSAEKASTFNLLKDFIFESGIDKYITIVRTKFSNFKNKDECTKDKENLCDENESIAKLCKSIVYVDNPPVEISVRDDDDKETIRINKRRRNQSREILLDHLDKICRKKYYKLKMWDKLHDKTSVRNIAQEVERNLNSEIPSLVYYFEEAESYSKPAQVDLPSPKIVEGFSSRETIETIGKLIIVGRTNSGKSTLAKVLEKKGTKYLVNDTGVTKLTKNIVKLYDGMCQFLFVIDGKFTAEEVKAIFDSGIYENITIVRTKFSNFKNEDECNKDKEDLYKEIRSLHKKSKIVAKICRSIVYVDNPPINISVVDEDDEKTNEINKKKRSQSRSILLGHLDKIFQEKYYELKAWLHSEASTAGSIGKEEHILKLEIPTLNLSYFEEAERSFKEKISSNITKNLGHNSNVCIKRYLKEWIEEEDISYFNYNEFSNIEKFDSRRTYETLKKANWKNKKILVVLKNLSNSQISENDFKEFIAKLKTFHKNYPNINRFFGLTRDSNGNYFSVLEYAKYANGKNLRDYLKSKFGTLLWCDKLQMALGITQGLMWLHSEEIIHGNLHACNILVINGMITITDLNLLKQAVTVTSENIAYVERQYLRNPHYERNIKSDVYSLGILLWELSSGRPPFLDYIQQVFGFARVENKLLNGEREKPVANTPFEYQQLYQNCWQDDPNLRPEIYEILAQLEKQSDIDEQLNTQVIDGKSSSTLDNDRLFDKVMFNRLSSLEVFNTKPQQIIRQFKLNHGLVLNGYEIMPSIQGVAVEDGELKLNLYKGQPLVYTCINSEENDLKIDTCINFPIAEIIYNGDLLESFIEKNFDNEKKSRELYGDFFARRVLTGGQLFIIDFNSATPTQIDTLKFYLYCVYNLAKYPTDFQFSSLFTLNTLPKLVTLDGKKLNTHEELTSWMNNLYQKKMVNIISYDELVPISRSERDTSLEDGDEIFKEIQPGVANFEEKLSLEEWVGDVTNDNLISWTKDFNLFQGFIINKNNEMLLSKKIPVDFIEIPKITLSNKSYLKIIKPSTELEFTLVSNNIFSIKNLSTLPFVKNNDNNHDGYNHVLVKCEKYEILLNTKNIKPTKEFEQTIEEALDSMKPLKALQDVFNEYGHLFPRRIILGRSLKNILPNLSPSNTFDVVNDDDKILESIVSLNISSLLTQKGRIIEKNNLHNWIRNTNNHLEIIEFDNIIPLYKILKTEHQKKIDDISKNNYRIIMTGIIDLTDLKNNNIENYKRINIGLSLESEDYEVFGLIITENNTKSEEIYVNFGLYDFNGFYAIIKKSEGTSADITKCFVLWVIIGNPSKLSVFSPKNREIQVNYIKETVTLQLDNSNYHKKIPFQGYKGHLFSVHAYCPHKPNINVQVIKPTCSDSISNTSIGSNSQKIHRDSRDSRDSLIDTVEVELRICVMSTNYKNLKIDHTKGKKEVEYPLDTSITTEVVNDFSPKVII